MVFSSFDFSNFCRCGSGKPATFYSWPIKDRIKAHHLVIPIFLPIGLYTGPYADFRNGVCRSTSSPQHQRKRQKIKTTQKKQTHPPPPPPKKKKKRKKKNNQKTTTTTNIKKNNKKKKKKKTTTKNQAATKSMDWQVEFFCQNGGNYVTQT